MPALPKVVLELHAPQDLLPLVYPNGRLGGVALEGQAPVAVGRGCMLVVRFREPAERHFNVKAQVSWARRKAPRGPKEGFGLDFVDAASRERLLTFAEGKYSTQHSRYDERVSVALPVTLKHQGRALREALADLSVGGAFVRTPSPLETGSKVDVSLRPPLSLRALRLKARVVWARRHGEAGMGLEFLYESAAQSERVRKLFERLRTKQEQPAKEPPKRR